MIDISIELWEEIQKSFLEAYSDSERVKELLTVLTSGNAGYKQATEYAEIVGDMWAKALQKHLRLDTLPDGKLYFNIANKTIKPAMLKDYEAVMEYTREVQKILNTAAGISFNAAIPSANTERITRLISKIASDEIPFEDTRWRIGEDVISNYSRSVVTDFVQKNAEFQKKAGLNSWIERKLGASGCCAWCRTMLGKYDYGSQPEDFFRVHKDCDCIIEFHPAKQRAKRITYTNENNVIRKITEDL